MKIFWRSLILSESHSVSKWTICTGKRTISKELKVNMGSKKTLLEI